VLRKEPSREIQERYKALVDVKKRRDTIGADVLAVGDLAHYLKLPVSTAYRLAEHRQIPGFKVGRQWRFDRPVLDAWLARKAVTRVATILVIDDDPAVCDLFASALAREDRKVLTATDGEQALALAKRRPVAVAVLDLVMPGLNGVQTFRQLRALDASLPVIIVTGFPDSRLLQEALAIGPFTVLAKPVGLQRLRAAVGMLLDRRGRSVPSSKSGPRAAASLRHRA
jgi:excisionase family DNA binding protein